MSKGLLSLVYSPQSCIPPIKTLLHTHTLCLSPWKAVTLRQRRIWKSQTRWRVEGGMDVDSFLGRSWALFRSWGVGAGEVCAFITEGDIETQWRERQADRQTKGERLDRERVKNKKLQDPRWRLGNVRILLLLFYSLSKSLSLFLFITSSSLSLLFLSWLPHKYSRDTFRYYHWTATCHSLSYSQTIHLPPHTHAHTFSLHHCLISYHIPEHHTVSLPLAIHFMLTQHQSGGLPSHSTHPIHRCTAYLSHLQGKQMMFISILSHRVCGSLHTTLTLVGSCYNTVCVD